VKTPGRQRRTALELDLAFQVDDCLSPALLAAAGDAARAADGEGEAFWTDRLGLWLEQLRPELPPTLRAPAYSLGLRLTDDAGIAPLNERWRGGSGPTDVLAFAAQEEAPPLPPGADARLIAAGEEPVPLELGDIVISLETAARQADAIGQDACREVLFLASHGLLHLLGWDHPDEESLAAMLALQTDLLAATPC
jgi:probable rRNA maturation factor